MEQDSSLHQNSNAGVICLGGPELETRYHIRGGRLTIGRDVSNDVVPKGEGCELVSAFHLEIRREQDRFVLYDLNSTNGTYLDGVLITTSVPLDPQSVIMLGSEGPQFLFFCSLIQNARLEETRVLWDLNQLGSELESELEGFGAGTL